MDFGAGLREVVGIPFSQQHRAFDSLGLGQLRRFFFGELKQGLTDAAGLRVTAVATCRAGRESPPVRMPTSLPTQRP